jgi:outer membrane protein assembly factor BamE (lipoprotein component of BamABCDE complex)
MKKTRKLLLLAAGATLALAACSPTVATRGNLLEDERLAQIRPGVSTRDDVAAVLGTPSSVGTFDPNVWYYIGQRTEKTAFFRPDVAERKVVVIRFDDTGVISAMEQLDASDGQEVEIVDRRTPTAGKELTVVEQIISNLGRFNNNGTGRAPGQATRVPGR